MSTSTAHLELQTVEGTGLRFGVRTGRVAFTRIEILHRVRGRDVSAAAVEEAVRLSDTKYCSVHAMLEPAVRLVSRFEVLPG